MTPDEALDQVKKDPSLRAVLEVARAWGVSPRRFFGWEPAIVVTPLQDGGWRVVREAEWDEDSQNLAVALTAYEADLCPGCSQPLSETTRPDREYGYRSPPPTRCHACTARITRAEEVEKLGTTQPDALLFGVELRDPAVRE